MTFQQSINIKIYTVKDMAHVFATAFILGVVVGLLIVRFVYGGCIS